MRLYRLPIQQLKRDVFYKFIESLVQFKKYSLSKDRKQNQSEISKDKRVLFTLNFAEVIHINMI